MNIAVRPADLVLDREGVIATLQRSLTPLSNDCRFEWLYKTNPHGQARVWIAVDTERDAIVGVAGAFPRLIYLGGRDAVVWILGDFCITEQHRSLGPALLLQRACLAAVEAEAIAFCYDCPSVSMMAVYKRLHIKPIGQLLRLARPLRVDRKIRRFIPSPVMARGLSGVGNLLLGLSSWRSPGDDTLTISLHRGECAEEFSVLSREAGEQYGICVQRSAAYLNWRYVTNPLYRYEMLTARRAGVLVAYAVFTQTGEDAILVDLFGVNEAAVIISLVERVVELLRERGIMTVSVPILETHPWVPLLQHTGFRVREACPVVVYVPSLSASQGSMFDGTKWFFMHGDRDS